MSQAFWIVIACGVLALVYGWFAYSQVKIGRAHV